MDKIVFKNPYRHLRSCFAKGLPVSLQDEKLLSLFHEARKKATLQGGAIRSHFAWNSLFEYEKTFAAYVRLIITCNLPLSYAENENIRRFYKYQLQLCKRTISSTILRLVELVENKNFAEMSSPKGALLFDGWSCSGVHYVASIASFMVVLLRLRDFLYYSVSPMAQLFPDKSEQKNSEAAIEFDSATHLSHFKQFFEFYKLSFENWVLCLICDNAPVNCKEAELSGNQ